jgi:hypothetical protein
MQAGLRDRALIGLMVYSFARVGAAPAGGDGSLHRHWLAQGSGWVHPCRDQLKEWFFEFRIPIHFYPLGSAVSGFGCRGCEEKYSEYGFGSAFR